MSRLLFFPNLVFLVTLFFFPIAFLFSVGIHEFSNSIFQDAYLLYVLRFTYWQALISASLSVLLGMFFAFLIKEWRVFGGAVLWRFSLLCSSLPSIIVALGILGSWGLQLNVFGWTGILLGNMFMNVAIPLRLIGTALTDRERSSELTAQSLGLSKFGVFRKITWLAIRSSVFSSWILTFLYSSTSLFIVMFLGGGPRFTTLEVALYEAIKLNLDNSRAVQISLLQAGVGAVLFFFYLKLQHRRKIQGEQLVFHTFFPKRAWVRGLGLGFLWCLAIAIFVFPLFSIISEGVPNLAFLEWDELWVSFRTTLVISTLVVFTSLFFLYPYLHVLHQSKTDEEARKWMWLVGAPQFFSPLVVCLALSVCFPMVRDSTSLSYLAIIATQVVFVIPVMHFPLREGFLRLAKERDWIARSLGANPWQRFFFAELPFMRRSLFLSALMGFGFSMGEVVSVLLFSPPGIKTLSLNIFQAMSRYRFQEARATTLVLLVAMFFVFSLVGFLEDKDESSSH